MTAGYYWYLRGEGDEGDLDADEPQVVYVNRDEVFVCGGDILYDVANAKGRFIGPLIPPSEDQ